MRDVFPREHYPNLFDLSELSCTTLELGLKASTLKSWKHNLKVSHEIEMKERNCTERKLTNAMK